MPEAAGAPGRANTGDKLMTLVASAMAGGDCIDDADVLRTGGTAGAIGCVVKVPSTLGTFLRSFRWGHVRQLDRVSRELLARAWAAGAGPGDAPFTIDLDSTICETYGLAKEGARHHGYTGKRGYHPLLAIAAGTGDVLMSRLREGRANTARGAAHFLRETVGRVRYAGASGRLTLRADSGFYTHGVVSVCRKMDVHTSGIMDSDGLTSPRYRYQWVRVASGGVETDIPRATSATYRVIADDVGVALKVKATFTDDKDNPESAESALTAAVIVAQVVASFSAGPYAAQEGGSVRVRVALDKNPHRTVTIPLIATPQGGADPGDYAAPTEVVFNTGQTSKDVTVTAVDDSVDDDGESVEVTFGRLPDGVSEGATTQAAVRITDNDGRGPQVVVPPPPPPPTTQIGTGGGAVVDVAPRQASPRIIFAPETLSFEAVEGGDDPEAQTLEVRNREDARMSFDVSDDGDWLTLSPTSGVSDGPDDEVEISVSVDVSGLVPGTYTATMEIRGAGIDNSPQSVSVTLVVRSTSYARQRVPPSERTEIVTPDSTVTLIVPENAVSSEVDIRIERLEGESRPEPRGEWDRLVFALDLSTFAPGGTTRQPTTYNPGVELRLLLPEDDAGACAAGRVEVYRVVFTEWRRLPHSCESDEDGRVWAVTTLTRFSTYALVIDDSPPAGSICWSVSNILSWTVSQISGSQAGASNTLLVWLKDVLRLWLDLSCS